VSLARRLPSIRLSDAVWLLLFAALGLASPTQNAGEIFLLSCLAALQVLEPRIEALNQGRGKVASSLIKLGLGYILVGLTSGVSSSYYLILLLPVVSAATTLSVAGTIAITLLACLSYLSFLLPVYVDWSQVTLTDDGKRELALRLLFLVVVAFLTYELAQASRRQEQRYRATLEELAAANRSLQEAEATIRRSERLAALGQLSAGLAHELRNPLGTIRASAEMLKKSVAAHDEVASELAGFISSEVDRMNSLVTRFLEFARPMELRLETCELAEVIDRAIARVERDSGAGRAVIYKNYSPDIRPFPMDAELLERVIYNLVLNAVQASPAGGAVTVKTRPAGEAVEISVIDRGAGIEPKHLENIFNPFFTTKPDGVGLGLSIVSKIVDQHGGTMSVESEAGRGSVFRVYLPTKPAGAASSPSP
jgi:signal transduction histidine kinase